MFVPPLSLRAIHPHVPAQCGAKRRPGEAVVRTELAHERVVVPGEHRPSDRRGQVHPPAGGPHIPLVADQRPTVGWGERPAPDAVQLPGGDGLKPGRWLDAAHADVEAEPVGQPGGEHQVLAFSEPVGVAGVELVDQVDVLHQLGQRSLWTISSQTCSMGAWRRQVLTK
jgi:hypothetical protein